MKDSEIYRKEMSADSNLLTLNGNNMGEYSRVVKLFASLSTGQRIDSQLVQYIIGRSTVKPQIIPKYISNNLLQNISFYMTTGHHHSEVYFGKSTSFYDSV